MGNIKAPVTSPPKSGGNGSPPKIGDPIQWTIGGVDQFAVPTPVVSISDCGRFCFVAGTATGLPVSQLTVVAIRPPKPPPAHIADADIEAVPLKLRQAKRWVGWGWTWIDDKDKWDKPPLDPRGIEIDQTDPANWLAFDRARRAARKIGDGVGIALGPKDNRLGIVGIDLDKCIDAAGNISAEASRIVVCFDSYTERTPSGNGLRILIWGDKPGPRCRTNSRPGIELYENDRYLTVTGRHLEGTPTEVHRRDDALKALYDEMFAGKPGLSPAAGVQPSGPVNASDDELIEKARRAKNGAKFTKLFDQGDIGGYVSQSEADQALANMLAFWTARDFNRIEAIFGRSAFGPRGKWQDRADYRQRTIDKAIDDCGEVYAPKPARSGSKGAKFSTNGTGSHAAEDDRPTIEISTERHEVVEKTLEALRRDKDLFCRGGSLGVVIEEEGPIAKLGSGVELENARGSSRFLPITEAIVGCHLTRNATFFCWKKDRKGEAFAADAHPTNWLISAVATHGQWPGIRRLRTIAVCPYVRSDGSIPAPGYDPTTGTLYRPSVDIRPLPDRPSKNDAVLAQHRLYATVSQFPFEDGYSYAAWLANLLTGVQRPEIDGAVPGFVYNGNKAGVGKGLLVDAIGLLVYSHIVPTRSYPMDPAEAAKIKLSLGLAGVSAVHFDNLPEGGMYGNGELDSAITSTEVEGRILGQSRESGSVSLRPLWMLSGNNVSPGKDAFRRWVPCNLVTPLESPHERSDIHVPNLRKHITENRADLLRDALIILKAHALAGRPPARSEKDDPTSPIGSFEEWDAIIRGAVWFATGTDCLHTQRKATVEAPERLEKIAFLEGWSQLPEGTGAGLTIEEAIGLVVGKPSVCPTFHSALLRMSRDGKIPSPKTVGYRIRGMKGQNVGGMKIEKVTENRDGSIVWKVINLHP